MDLKQLTYFVTIVEEGNITSAAKKLHIAQPPLSHQLKQLEEELQVRLLDRGARKVTLTDAGRILYKRANHILELADTAKKEVSDIQNKQNSTLSLGTISSSGTALLNERMTKFHRSFPNVRFEIHEGNTYELIELLHAGIIEVGIVRTPFPAEGFDSVYLEPEPMAAVYHSHFFSFDKEMIRLEELKRKPIILYRRFENLIHSCCIEKGFEPDVFCKNDDARTTLMWANKGLGIGMVPMSASKIIRGENMICKAIDEPKLCTKIGAIWRKQKYLSSAAQSFLLFFGKE